MKKISENGITLIALVITIIILLILAGVTISIVFNDGIIEKSEKAVDDYIAAQQNEEELLYYLNKMLITEVNNLNGTENKKMIEDIDFSYYNPIVPVGFKTVNAGSASWKIVEDEKLGYIVSGWNNGLVIEDKDGNQFVWVPVDGIEVEYYKWYKPENYIPTDEKLPDGISSEQNQIEKYKGFYIARYEAGIPENMSEARTMASNEARNVYGNPVSKKNQIPWTYIDYDHLKANAESMYSNEFIQSGLITGTQWDTVLKWIENSGENVRTINYSWGNFKNSKVTGITEYISKDSIAVENTIGAEKDWIKESSPVIKEAGTTYLLKTGNSEFTKRKNIYDLAGNCWDVTNESRDGLCIVRGGAAGDAGYPAIQRNTISNDNLATSYNMSSRCVLYVK